MFANNIPPSLSNTSTLTNINKIHTTFPQNKTRTMFVQAIVW